MARSEALQRGVVLDLETLHPQDLELSRLQASLPHWKMFQHSSAADVAERIRDADVVVSNKVPLEASTLAEAGNLRLICVAATGVDNVDLEAAKRYGITVTNARRYATPSVVEHVFSLILTLVRRLDEYRRAVDAGAWQHSRNFCLLDFPIRELAGSSIGIIGYGELGKAVAEVARAFGMQVLIAQRQGTELQPPRLPLSELLARADIVTLHCPLTDLTRNLIGTEQLHGMKSDAFLINTARGGLVDEQALVHALRQGVIGGAGIDVLTQEPPSQGNPLLAAELPNLIVTPHVAWASREARQRLVDQVAENIQAFANGQGRNLVGTG